VLNFVFSAICFSENTNSGVNNPVPIFFVLCLCLSLSLSEANAIFAMGVVCTVLVRTVGDLATSVLGENRREFTILFSIFDS
jgi:hypothetical protein